MYLSDLGRSAKMSTLSITVGFDLSPEELLSQLKDSDEDLSGLLTLDVELRDPKATADDGVNFTDVEKISEGIYSLGYNYDWSAYYGCRDWNKSDTFYSDIRFRYVGDQAIFEMPEYDYRDTLE
jgi:hypothetical protein